MQPQFTPAEIERMRTILAQHDNAQAGNGNTFDLNNPPKKTYVHQDFPRLIYNHEERIYRTVGDEDTLQELLTSGWSMEPFEVTYEGPKLSLAEQVQVENLDRLIEEAKRKRKAA
jgi:hypothetical protein